MFCNLSTDFRTWTTVCHPASARSRRDATKGVPPHGDSPVRDRSTPCLGCHQAGSGPFAGRADAARLRQAGRLCGLADVAGLNMAVAPGLRRQQPDVATVRQRAERVGQSVEQITVVVAPPHQHDVDHVVVVLVDQLALGDRLDGAPQLLVAVVVVADLLHHLARLDAEPFGQAALRLTRGRAHERPPCVGAAMSGHDDLCRSPLRCGLPDSSHAGPPRAQVSCPHGSKPVHLCQPPSRKLSRTLRTTLSTLRSTTATDCHVPSAILPSMTGIVAYGGMTAGMTCDLPCPRDPCEWVHRSSLGSRVRIASKRSTSLPAPSSMRAIPAVAWGTKMFSRPSCAPARVRNSPHSPVMSCTVS